VLSYTPSCLWLTDQTFGNTYSKYSSRVNDVQIKTYVVEDSPTIRDNLIATLEELTGVVTVGTAETEKEGVDWLTNSSNAWDLAIVDLFLKQGTGLGVVLACKKRFHTQKVIVLSNYATPDVRKQCVLLGADAVFDKSTEIEQLLEYCVNLSQ
jgi:two-component system, OmpR family, response regulator